MMTVKTYVREHVQRVLIYFQLPLLYQRVVVWWEFHSSLRDLLKAARILIQQRGIALRNATFGTAMIVATKQIQSRAELRDMTYKQIMAAYRYGRLDFLMQNSGISYYGDKAFHEWVKNGGQWKP